MLWFIPLTKGTASSPTGLLDASGEPILRTLTVPELGAGRYVPASPAEIKTGEPRRLLFYPEGWRDPIAIGGPNDVDGVPHYYVQATVGRNRQAVEDYLRARLGTVETAPEAMRKDARKRAAMKAQRARVVRNDRGKPVAPIPPWCVGNARALATAGEDPEEMQELPDLEEARTIEGVR